MHSVDTGRAQVIDAEWVWTGTTFARGLQIAVDAAGRIARIGPPAAEATVRFPRRALLPGFVNAHSHAFQRALRGEGERFPRGAGSFWTWREAMYRLVETLDRPRFFATCLAAFREMRAAGITTVGEFHYLHHATDGEDYAFDHLLIDAAREARIRLVLIACFYRTGGIGRPLAGGQLKFRTPDLTRFGRHLDGLAHGLDPSWSTLAVAAHSIRAATPEEIRAVHAMADARGLPFHLHAEEQRQEVEDCVRAYGKRPLRVLLEALPAMERVAIVHGTHADPDDLAAFFTRGGTVVLCPLTEGNLGDGVPSTAALSHSGSRFAFGTDSNARIAMVEEMRWEEYVHRLATERRGIYRSGRDEGDVSGRLLDAATRGGAQALGVPAGTLHPGYWADFVLLDLDHPVLAGCTPQTLLDALLTGSGNETIAATAVGGVWT